MSNEIILQNNQEVIQKLVLDGDLGRMTPAQKVSYYNSFCQSLGLNPLTQPFQIIKFQGKERLYATKDCTEQLRKIHGVSITDIATSSLNGVFIVTAKAKDKTGKTDASTGVVPIEGLKGDNLANALMKAETKAKRRVTLSICGLGILDESETDTLGKVETSEVQEAEVVSAAPKQLPGATPAPAPARTPEEVLNAWRTAFQKCTTMQELDAFYTDKKEKIERNPQVFDAYMERKQQLQPSPAKTATA